MSMVYGIPLYTSHFVGMNKNYKRKKKFATASQKMSNMCHGYDCQSRNEIDP